MTAYFPSPQSLSLELVWSAFHVAAPDWRHFAARVEAASLWQVLAGELRVESDGLAQVARAGDWVWRVGCGARRMSVGAAGARWRSVGLVALCGGRNWFAPAHSHVFRPAPRDAERGALLMQLLVEGQIQNAQRLELDGLARALVGWLWRISEQDAPDACPPWLLEALRTIEREPQVSVAQLAARAHFSGAQFRRLWGQHLSEAPRQTLARRRLEKARALLEEPDLSVAEIALRSGFSGSAQLGRAFRAAFDSAPLEWRRAARERI